MVKKIEKIVASNLRVGILIFLLALIVRLVFVLTLEDKLYWPDERVYDETAWGVVQGKGYLAPSYRAPGWPSFLAGIYFLFGHSFFAARVVQTILGGLTCVLIYFIATKTFGKKTAFLAAFASIFYPPFVYISGVLFATNLFTFLIALSIFMLLKLKIRSSFIIYILTGFFFGLTVLCQPVFLSFVPFGLLYIFIFQKKTFLKKTGLSLLILFVTLFTIFPWTIRNYIVYNKFVLVSAAGCILWNGNNPLAEGNSEDHCLVSVYSGTKEWLSRLSKKNPEKKRQISVIRERLKESLSSDDEIERDKILKREAIRFMRKNPGHTLRLFARKLVVLYTPFTKTVTQNVFTSSSYKLFISLVFYPILFFAFVGFLFSLFHWRNALILYFIIFSHSLTYVIFTVCTRYRIPIDLYLIIFASFGAVKIFARLKPALHAKNK